ncbi:ABC transporter ATP-binding protein [Neobacillus drentensis]|uniref:ABC transporter ATP-binding protein n=1 Tax=Neobacillus drentensis TaxID=220684 RepID=UPI001F470C60|nr:ABC transporter ATP-binding protein [Neobacillus drentensis]ULT54593.1 ABC transporter ATP-binding protein [Neobacillus drentensis]
MEFVLEAKGVNKVFGAKRTTIAALNEIDINIAKGEFVAVMGPSGSGKSSLLNVLSSIEAPTSGSIRIEGMELTKLKEEPLREFRRDKLGFIFQDYNLLDTLTVAENIMLPLVFTNCPKHEIKQKMNTIAERFGIQAIIDKYPYEISGGQQQRTAVCRALIGGPTILFADEPTGALDSTSAYQLLQTLSKLNENQLTTILMVTHDPFAASFCSRVIFIKDGSLFTEIHKGESTREQLFQQILSILSTLGGGQYDAV